LKLTSCLAVSTVIFLAPWFSAGVLAQPSSGGHHMVSPQELVWSSIASLPKGAEIAMIEGPLNEAKPFIIRLKFPAGYRLPAHSHPAIEHVTVISGQFFMGVGDQLDPRQGHGLVPGSVAIMQPGVNHFAYTEEPTIVQVHGVGPWGLNYVNPADDPRKKNP